VDRVGVTHHPPSTLNQNIQIEQKSATPKTKPRRGGKQMHSDAAPNLVPTELLAMQGLDAAPNLVPTELLAMQGR